jgi:hypothetical protein
MLLSRTKMIGPCTNEALLASQGAGLTRFALAASRRKPLSGSSGSNGGSGMVADALCRGSARLRWEWAALSLCSPGGGAWRAGRGGEESRRLDTVPHLAPLSRRPAERFSKA